MSDERANERTETDDRDDENRDGAVIEPLDRRGGPDIDPATGLPRGMHDDDSSPLDPGEPLDPFDDKAPGEPGAEPVEE